MAPVAELQPHVASKWWLWDWNPPPSPPPTWPPSGPLWALRCKGMAQNLCRPWCGESGRGSASANLFAGPSVCRPLLWVLGCSIRE